MTTTSKTHMIELLTEWGKRADALVTELRNAAYDLADDYQERELDRLFDARIDQLQDDWLTIGR